MDLNEYHVGKRKTNDNKLVLYNFDKFDGDYFRLRRICSNEYNYTKCCGCNDINISKMVFFFEGNNTEHVGGICNNCITKIQNNPIYN